MNNHTETELQEIVQLSSTGRVVYCGAASLHSLFKSGCSDAEITLYAYYLLTMTVNNCHVLNLPLEQIRKDLRWGQDKLVEAKASLTKKGLIKSYGVRGKDGKIKYHRLVVFTGLNDAQITRSTETTTVVTRLVGETEKEQRTEGLSPKTPILREETFSNTSITSLEEKDKENNPPLPPQGGTVAGKWSEKNCPYFISRFPKQFQDSPEFVKQWTEWEIYRAKTRKAKVSNQAVSATINEISANSFSVEDVITSIGASISGDYRKLVIHKIRNTQFPGSFNGATKTCLQPNADSLTLYWGHSLARHASKGLNPANFRICNYKTKEELLEALARRMNTVWFNIVGQDIWDANEPNHDNRLTYYKQEVPKILNFINNIPDVPENNHKELFDNPMVLFERMDAFFASEKNNGIKYNYKAIRFGRDLWFEFVTWLENSWQINFATGQRRIV